MGSPSKGNKAIDSSVGGLVWVRRRNGKWWPGRILGPEELPETCVASPRSGTPVKLLGREDASVDWYNLEKSIRVKAFRCGEYDECIEKAKAAAANSLKKCMKHARREDAILHALEIESARLGKDHPDFYSRAEKPDEKQQAVEGSPSTLDPHDEDTDNMEEDFCISEDDSDSAPELSQSGVSFEDPNHTCASKEQSVWGRRRQTPNDSEDDGTERVQRMKGLDDLGMDVVSSSGMDVVSSSKRKRTQVAHVHEFLKRKQRRRTLTKVLESTAMVSVPVMCEQLGSPTGSLVPVASDSKLSGIEFDESKKHFSLENETSSLCPENGSSDGLYDVPFVAEENQLAGLWPTVSSGSPKARVGTGAQSSQCSHVETVSLVNEELNESGSTSSGTAEIHSISGRVHNATSEWQLKGKRSRHANKTKRQDSGKAMDTDDEYEAYLVDMDRDADCNTLGGPLPSEKRTHRLKCKQFADFHVDEYRGWGRNRSHKESFMNCAIPELQTPQRFLPLRQSRFMINPKYEDYSLKHHTAESSLYDVNLEVKASYRPRHVPYVSLMSKLTGQPIIGHPLTVEALDDGFLDNLMSGSECYNSSCDLSEDRDESTSALGSGPEVDYEEKSTSTGRSLRKRTLQQGVSPSKTPKSRKNASLSQKMRKLSSITGAHKQSEDQKNLAVEKLKGPAVACVPLNLVFSRINAALNSSTRSAHRLSAPSNA